jgi:protein-S-isoprenylcysteine O-methyltransferase Ste14
MNIFWLILAVLLWGFIHSLLASASVKALTQRVFGAAERRYYRLAYNILACISFLPVLVITAFTPDHNLYTIPFPWVIPTLVGQLLAVVALMIGFRQTDAWEFLGLRQLSRKEKQPMKLTASGLYRYVRHPLYTAGIIFIWLMPIMTVNVLAINLGLTVYVLVGAYFEERKLRREFGAQYAAYQAVTPMLIPGLRLRWNKK